MSKEIPINTILNTKEQDYPVTAAFLAQFFERSTLLLRSQIMFLLTEREAFFWPTAEKILKLNQNIDGNPIDALLEYTVAFLREQIKFLSTGDYRYDESTFDDAFKEVYDNPDVMEAFYLEGLLVTHAFWPIHLDMHRFFEESFLQQLKQEESLGVELGFGHGLYLFEILDKYPKTKALGFDISQYSLAYANKLLLQNGIAADRFDLALGDVREPLSFDDSTLDWCVFAEVLEHIPTPDFALREIARCLKPDGLAFITTAINSNAIDHLWHFNTLDEVTAMLNANNLEIVALKELPLADYDSKSKDPTIDCAFVCKPLV